MFAMNLLAHIYLSGSDKYIKIGNFIGDYVKGRKYREYPCQVQKGILLHRTIDSFTDDHAIPREVKSILRPYYRKYAGIVVDVFYDHFLAGNWHTYSGFSLDGYIADFYRILKGHFDLLPAGVQQFVPRMISHNRLYAYRRLEGVEKALSGMSKYSSLPEETDAAMRVLVDYYELIQRNFNRFFPVMIDHVTQVYNIDIKRHHTGGAQ